MALSDEKLMLLEQVTYMDKNVYTALGWKYPDDQENIMTRIREMEESDISKLDNLKVKSDEMTGAEWQDIIHAIKSDNELLSYNCVEYNKDAGAYCFANNNNEAVVAFRGTLRSNNEWPDNAVSLCTADTPAQIVALNYVNKLSRYDSVSLVGHSKGGNKAQYCAILADQVNIDKCVSMDGEGFSKEFLEKYDSQIAEKGSMIKDYSYKNDFVNILLNDVPGSKQIYCDGNATGLRCHFSNSMFELVKTGDGWHVVYSEVPQNEGMKYLHEFTCYMANNMSKKDRYETAEFLSVLLEHLAGNKKNEPFDIFVFLSEHPDNAAVMLSYLVAYLKENKLTNKQIEALLRAFGIDNEKIELLNIPFNMDDVIKILRELVENIDLTNDLAQYTRVLGEIRFFFKDNSIGGKVEKMISEIFGNGEKLSDKEKYRLILDILNKTQKYYNKNIKNKKKNLSETDAVNNSWVQSTGWMKNIVVGTIGVNNITVTPEQLKAQSAQFDSLKLSYDTLSSEIVSLIDQADKALSENMQNNIQMKVNILKDNLSGISDLLESGARAAGTAAITYESVDKELAKRISKL